MELAKFRNINLPKKNLISSIGSIFFKIAHICCNLRLSSEKAVLKDVCKIFIVANTTHSSVRNTFLNDWMNLKDMFFKCFNESEGHSQKRTSRHYYSWLIFIEDAFHWPITVTTTTKKSIREQVKGFLTHSPLKITFFPKFLIILFWDDALVKKINFAFYWSV